MALVLIAVMALPMTVLAAPTGTTVITGDVGNGTISISLVPTGGNLGSLTVNGDTSYSSDQIITVTGSGDTFNLIVRDNNQSDDIGKMKTVTNVLTSPLKVKGGTLGYTALPTVAESTLTLVTNGDLSTGTYSAENFNVQQHVAYSDAVDSGYSITLYFEVAYTGG